MFKRIVLTLVLISSLVTAFPVRADSTIPPVQRLGTGIPTSIAASPDGKTLAVGSSIGVWFLDAETLQPFGFWDTGFWVNSVAYSTDGKYVKANEVVLDAGNGSRVEVEAGQVAWIDDKCSPGGRFCTNYRPLAMPFYDASYVMQITDTNTTVIVGLVKQWDLLDIAWSPDNSKLFTVAIGSDAEGWYPIRAWDTQTWKETTMLRDYFAWKSLCDLPNFAHTCEPSPMRAWWHDIHIYNPETNQLLKRFTAHRISLDAAKLSLDGTLLATSGTNSIIGCARNDTICRDKQSTTRIWNFATQKMLAELPVDFADIVFSPDNNLVIGLTSNGYEVWDWKAGRRLDQVSANTGNTCGYDMYWSKNYFSCIAISPNGKFIAIGVRTNSGVGIQVRQLATGDLLANLGGHTLLPSDTYYYDLDGYEIDSYGSRTSPITEITFSANGTQVAATGNDHTTLIWNVP